METVPIHGRLSFVAWCLPSIHEDPPMVTRPVLVWLIVWDLFGSREWRAAVSDNIPVSCESVRVWLLRGVISVGVPPIGVRRKTSAHTTNGEPKHSRLWRMNNKTTKRFRRFPPSEVMTVLAPANLSSMRRTERCVINGMITWYAETGCFDQWCWCPAMSYVEALQCRCFEFSMATPLSPWRVAQISETCSCLYALTDCSKNSQLCSHPILSTNTMRVCYMVENHDNATAKHDYYLTIILLASSYLLSFVRKYLYLICDWCCEIILLCLVHKIVSIINKQAW